MSLTLNIQIGKKLYGKTKDDILKQLLTYFPLDVVVAVQIAHEVIRVTFKDLASYKRGMEKDGVRLFGMWCPIMGGGPSVMIVHVIDFPFEEQDSFIEEVLRPYGTVKAIKKQTFLAMDDIYTGTRLVSLVMKSRPPRDLMIKGFLCRTWYRRQPLVCNLCAVEGHGSANCPNKDKCHRFGESGHFAHACPNSRVSFAEAAAGSTGTSVDASQPSDASAVESTDVSATSSGWLTRLRSRFSTTSTSGGASGEAFRAVSAASGGPSDVVPPAAPSESVSRSVSAGAPVVSAASGGPANDVSPVTSTASVSRSVSVGAPVVSAASGGSAVLPPVA